MGSGESDLEGKAAMGRGTGGWGERAEVALPPAGEHQAGCLPAPAAWIQHGTASGASSPASSLQILARPLRTMAVHLSESPSLPEL